MRQFVGSHIKFETILCEWTAGETSNVKSSYIHSPKTAKDISNPSSIAHNRYHHTEILFQRRQKMAKIILFSE